MPVPAGDRLHRQAHRWDEADVVLGVEVVRPQARLQGPLHLGLEFALDLVGLEASGQPGGEDVPDLPGEPPVGLEQRTDGARLGHRSPPDQGELDPDPQAGGLGQQGPGGLEGGAISQDRRAAHDPLDVGLHDSSRDVLGEAEFVSIDHQRSGYGLGIHWRGPIIEDRPTADREGGGAPHPPGRTTWEGKLPPR